MSRHFPAAILSSLLLFTATSNVFAHAFHITVAEAELNRKTGRIEVAMRVHPGDLELALGRIANRRIRLEKEPKIDALITNYLQRSIQLRPASSAKTKSAPKPAASKEQAQPGIKWVGKEVSVKWAWLYFELPAVKQLNGATITNRVFHEILTDQENTIILKDGNRKQTIMCRKDKATVTIELRRTKATR